MQSVDISALREVLVERRKVVLGIAGAVLIAVIAIVVAMVVFRDQTSDMHKSDPEQVLSHVDVNKAISDAGGHCSPLGNSDRQSCTMNTINFQLARNTWVTQAGQRERECDQGQANSKMMVLTNHDWMIYADQQEQLAALRDDLGTHGATADITGYCTWDQ